MTANYTPGPWRVEEQSYKSSSFYIRGSKADGNPMTWGLGAVAHIPRSKVLPSEANARLIAAAPELLDAISELVKLHHDWDKGSAFLTVAFCEKNKKAIEEARAAIAKATGG